MGAIRGSVHHDHSLRCIFVFASIDRNYYGMRGARKERPRGREINGLSFSNFTKR